jgi:hypothetical protein
MIEKRIILTERIGVPRFGEFVRIGVPFAEGELYSPEFSIILSSEKEEKPVQATPLNYWRDGSIKWMLIDFTATVPAKGQAIYRLIINHKEKVYSGLGISIKPGDDTWQVDTGVAIFSISAREFRLFASVKNALKEVLTAEGLCTLQTADNKTPVLEVESILIESEGPLRAILAVRGRCSGTGQEMLYFSSRLHFFADRSFICLDFTIQNPHRAHHRGGFWDLGDAGSIFFKELALDFWFPEGKVTEIQCSTEWGKAPIRCSQPEESVSVYQESSGGKNWLSPVHRNRDGRVPFTFSGYEIRSGTKQVGVGTRATPVIWCGSGSSGVSAVVPHFWQEFPKAIGANRHRMKIALFPGLFPDLHELQGGEQKTHTIGLDFDSPPDGLEWARSPLSVTVAAADICHSNVVSDLPCFDEDESGKGELVDQFIDGPEEFLRKREAVDEYGWRNFGDIYADHEAVYHEGPELFISHYNNQYDICAGMYRKYMATGDPLWGELAFDLAKHVLDIDIYHTSLDREEYNQGLFWHTDHYLPAGLSTHRSFSREQIGDKDSRFCGGGPGAEHCYTTGLMVQYFLTGNPAFRDAVIYLADWVLRSLSGPTTVLEVLNKSFRYFKMLLGTGNGSRPIFPKYPLTRGTGNALIACLDAYEVSGDDRFLGKAEELIKGALHPEDDIALRNLLDTEAAWSYTVLLVSVAKFLNKKIELEQIDAGYEYAKACLLAYAEWMCLNEYPYLDKSEILEYPNETWPTQDLRKSVIFYYAARFADEDRRRCFLCRGNFFYAAAKKELSRHQNCSLTRPVALMLQNGWVGAHLEGIHPVVSVQEHPVLIFGKPTSSLCPQAVVARIWSEFCRALRETTLRRELAWLTSRLF